MDTTRQLTEEDKYKAATNSGYGTFTLGTREFEIKDLEYDDYLEFCRMAQPIIKAVANAVEPKIEGGRISTQLNPAGIDFDVLIELAGKQLVKMAMICCRQSEPKITEKEVKKLGRRPQNLLEVVLLQIHHNGLVQEFVDFFQRMSSRVAEMMPAAQEAMMPVAMGDESLEAATTE
jgi:hypothetical protein